MWPLEDGPSGGCPPERQRLPPPVPPFRFGWYVKRKRRYVCAEGGQKFGERLRFSRRTPAEAVAEARVRAAELERFGELALRLSGEERWMMARCVAICAPLGLSPLEACQQISDAHPKGGKARTVAQVVGELVAKKRAGNRREKYVDTLERELVKFAGLFPGRGIHTITTGELEDELDRHPRWAPATVHGHVSSWKVLFNYARKHEYSTKNPCEAMELPERDGPEPQIFPVEQVRAMFAHTLFRDRDPLLPCCQPYLALGIFAGIRPEEIERLNWEEVDCAAAAVTVLGAKSKVRARRIVELAPNALTWLRPWARQHGAVLRHPLSELRKAIRGAMGLREWPHDVLRHSFGSYHFGFHRNEALVKNQMGHSDDGRMFFSHYRVVVTRAEAAKFWRIAQPAGLLTR